MLLLSHFNSGNNLCLLASLSFLRFSVCCGERTKTQPTIEDLESQLADIDQELANTARFTLRSGVGNVGWFSLGNTDPKQTEWLEVELPPDSSFDQLVLIPVLWNDAQEGPQADGFPEAFRIIVSSPEHPKGRLVLERDNLTQPFLPRIAPLVLQFPTTKATRIRIEGTRLGVHARDEKNRRFKLAEVMVFSGEKNIALEQPVRVSSLMKGWGAAAISAASSRRWFDSLPHGLGRR